MSLLTEPEMTYAAGLFDGRLRFRTNSARGVELRVPHTDQRVTSWLVEKFGGKQYRTKNSYEWRLYSKRDIAKTLHVVAPFMLSKQDEARKVRDFCTLPRRNAAKKG